MHKRKMIAPIIIAVLVVAYYVVIGIVFTTMLVSLPLKVIMIVIPALLAGVMIYVLIERIKEIKEGEEDDLGKY